MANFIVCFHKPKDANLISNLLGHAGFPVACSCMSGARALEACDKLGSGILVCGYHLPDMLCTELYESLPRAFSMMVMCPPKLWGPALPPEGIETVDLPAPGTEILQRVEEAELRFERRRERERRNSRRGRSGRSPEELLLLAEAKTLLMHRKHLNESEAHKYLQKLAMDTGQSMAETAARVKLSFQTN